jgi:ornithine cyclodeaminase/alanine dehydrogenase-like protein (mu-crystallin family)
MLILTNDDVRKIVEPRVVLDALQESYGQLYNGEAVCRPMMSIAIPTSDPNSHYSWTSVDGGSTTTGYFASRIKNDIRFGRKYNGTVTRDKYSTRPGKYCGFIFLVNIENAEPLAIIHDSVIQRLRVGADAAIGTRHMARPNSEVFGILGSGGMAKTQLDCTIALCPSIKKVQIYSPTRDNREAFARDARMTHNVEVVALDSGQDVFKGADIVASCTDGGFAGEENNASVVGRWLEPGQHWTSISGGSWTADRGGCDATAKQRTDVVLRCTRTPAPLGLPEWEDTGGQEIAGSIHFAVPPENPRYKDFTFYQGRFGHNARNKRRPIEPKRVVYLVDLLAGQDIGRASDSEITFSESGNISGAQFHAVAGKVYEAAVEQGLGRTIPTEWFLEDERN